MIVGQLICDRCGKNCTSLYGYGLMTRGTIRSKQQQEELEAVRKEFGKNEFVFCWGCVAKVFGVKTLAEKEAEAKAEIPIEEQDKNKPELESDEPPIKSRYKK